MKAPKRAEIVADMTVRELAEYGGQEIVRRGGPMGRTSARVPCFPSRVDTRLLIEVYDPARGTSRRLVARVRLTVEDPPEEGSES